MEYSVKEIVKTCIISILAVIVIILIILVFSYNKISISRFVPSVEKYEANEDVKLEIESEDEEQTEVVTTYILDAPELKYYERTKEYNKGKKHPFAENRLYNNSSNDEENETPSENFYDDEGK